MLKTDIKLSRFVLLLSVLNFLLFHYPFFKYVFKNINYKSFNGGMAIVSLVVLMLIANAFVFYLLFYLSKYVGKFLIALIFS